MAPPPEAAGRAPSGYVDVVALCNDRVSPPLEGLQLACLYDGHPAHKNTDSRRFALHAALFALSVLAAVRVLPVEVALAVVGMALLAAGFARNWHSLLIGIDFGGLGTPIASLRLRGAPSARRARRYAVGAPGMVGAEGCKR